MNLAVALRLGRVSNLPTVWTNALAGIVLAGGHVADRRTLPLIVAFSLFYVAGMYLNDAYDAGIDARERPERPIPSGRVNLETVFTIGFAMMALGLALLAWTGYGGATGTGLGAVMGGLGLGAAIVLYNRRHKDNPLSPVLMGICRVLVYVTAGLAVALELPTALWVGAFLLLCYLIGLTYVAKQETLGEVRNLWPLLFLGAPLVYAVAGALESPIAAVLAVAFVLWVGIALWFLWRRQPGDVPRAVVSLIAGISLLDAVLIAGAGDVEHRLAGGRRLCAHARPATVRAGHLNASFDRPRTTSFSARPDYSASGAPTVIMRRISSVLRPIAIGRRTPGSTATSYSSSTTPSIRSQCTASPVRRSTTIRPQRGSASRRTSSSSSGSPVKVRFSRGLDRPITANGP